MPDYEYDTQDIFQVYVTLICIPWEVLFGNLQNLGQSIARGLGNIPLAFWLLANKEIKLTLPLASGLMRATLRLLRTKYTHKIGRKYKGWSEAALCLLLVEFAFAVKRATSLFESEF